MGGKKKYPWIKSIFSRKKATPPAAVYAGPEYWDKKRKDGDNGTTEPVPDIVNDVYAGPEYFGEPEEPGNETVSDDTLCEPGEFSAVRPPVPPVMMVYAAPGFFPGEKNNGTDMPPFQNSTMPVYAGPEYYKDSQFRVMPGAFVNTSREQPDPEDGGGSADDFPEEGFTRCPCCGAKFPDSLKFCPECGTDNPAYDNGEKQK
ncbi:MAG: hypothetical protein IJU57_06535 [Clostridia bacterium]|nr:hypothetical protein [Clostridia bacterium]